MNIFQHNNGYFDCSKSRVMENSLHSLFKLAKEIREKLGKQGYLLDCYLSSFFEGVNYTIALRAADTGFQLGGSLQDMLRHILDHTEPKKQYQFYLRAQQIYKEYIADQPFQEYETNLFLLQFALADEVMSYYTAKYMNEELSQLNLLVDKIHHQEIYDQICSKVGETMMEELNQRLKERFIITSVGDLFAQGFTNDLLYKLTCRDPETSKQMFQLLLDRLPEE